MESGCCSFSWPVAAKETPNKKTSKRLVRGRNETVWEKKRVWRKHISDNITNFLSCGEPGRRDLALIPVASTAEKTMTSLQCDVDDASVMAHSVTLYARLAVEVFNLLNIVCSHISQVGNIRLTHTVYVNNDG